MNEFNYEVFKKSLLESEDGAKKEIMSTYIKNYGSNPLEREPFFTDFLIKFPIPNYNVPSLDTKFNWTHLCMLVCGSFSSQYYFKYSEKGSLPDLILEVSNSSDKIVQSVADIDDSYKIKRLFEIYIEEQFSLANLFYDLEENVFIEIEREEKIEIFKKKLEKLERERMYRDHLNSSRNTIRSIIGYNKEIPF